MKFFYFLIPLLWIFGQFQMLFSSCVHIFPLWTVNLSSQFQCFSYNTNSLSWYISFLGYAFLFEVTCVADIKSTTSKIKYYKTKQYSTIKKTGFTTSTGKTKKYWWTSKQDKHQIASMNYILNTKPHSALTLITFIYHFYSNFLLRTKDVKRQTINGGAAKQYDVAKWWRC